MVSYPFLDPFQCGATILLMMFVRDHALSKYVPIEIILTKYGYIYGVFSRAVHRKSRYFIHSVSMRVLEVRYSCYYVLLLLCTLGYTYARVH